MHIRVSSGERGKSGFLIPAQQKLYRGYDVEEVIERRGINVSRLV